VTLKGVEGSINGVKELEGAFELSLGGPPRAVGLAEVEFDL
jgi:hypothetical protein